MAKAGALPQASIWRIEQEEQEEEEEKVTGRINPRENVRISEPKRCVSQHAKS
jgi:hypothetical protein